MSEVFQSSPRGEVSLSGTSLLSRVDKRARKIKFTRLSLKEGNTLWILYIIVGRRCDMRNFANTDKKVPMKIIILEF